MIGGVFSGVPSTAWALATGRDPLEATWAAGRLLRPQADHGVELLGAATAAHGALSLGWTVMLTRALGAQPRTRTRRAMLGGLAGLGIAVLDLGGAHALGRHARFAPIAALPVVPQVADHVAFGALVGWSLAP